MEERGISHKIQHHQVSSEVSQLQPLCPNSQRKTFQNTFSILLYTEYFLSMESNCYRQSSRQRVW